MRCFLWVWADMGFNLLVGHLGCLHFVSPNVQISFIREKWYLSLLSDLLWGQNSHKYPDYFKAIGVNNINNKKCYRNLFLLDHQHLANLWSWRLQVSQPALSLHSGLHLQERWLTGPSMTVRLWSEESSFTCINRYCPVSLPLSLIRILASVSQTLPLIWGSASYSV